MKRTSFILPVLLLFIACNFSKGVKKDLNTGLTSSYNGFHVEDTYLEDGTGIRLNSNKVALGATLLVVANGVTNFKEKEGRVYPGCKIVLTDTSGKEILNIPDAFASNTEGFKPTEATRLTATLNTGSPMEVGALYNLQATFFDKQNKDNRIVSVVQLDIK